MNKKGNVLSIWWIFIWVFIAVGVASGAGLFFSSNLDTRALDSDILSSKVLNCISSFEGVDKNILDDNFDFFKICKLNEGIFGQGSNYFVKIIVLDFYDKNQLAVHRYGNAAFEQECEIQKNVLARNYPSCAEKEVYLFNEGEDYLVRVIVGANERGGNYEK